MAQKTQLNRYQFNEASRSRCIWKPWCWGNEKVKMNIKLWNCWQSGHFESPLFFLSLYKFGSCLFVRLFVRYVLSCFFNGSWLGQIKSKLHQTFSICKVWSPNLFKIVWASPRACVHAQRVKSCTLFLPIFLVICLTFSMSSAAILKPFLTENEKTEATLQIGIDDAQLFHFINFFPFW